MMPKKDNPYDYVDVSKMFADFKVPGVDWQEVMASQQKNLAALTQANQRLLDGAQAVMQQQTEVLNKAMGELAAASSDLMKESDPQEGAKKRFDLAKSSFETAIGNMQELAEVAGKSNGDALEIINRRAAEAFEEIKAVIKAKS
ncbi:MAG: phasin family protein [Geminicoccaceae bacterium]